MERQRPWGLEQQSSAYWEDKYWEVVRQFSTIQHQFIRARGLEAKNYQQASILMEYFLCYKIVGDTVYLDARKLKRLILERHHERSNCKIVERRALSTSKYIKG